MGLGRLWLVPLNFRTAYSRCYDPFFRRIGSFDIARECFDSVFALPMHGMEYFMSVGMPLHYQCAVIYMDDIVLGS